MSSCFSYIIECVKRKDIFLFHTNRIIERNGGEAPLTYNQFQAIVASMDSPLSAAPTVTLDHLRNIITPISEDHDEKYGCPTLHELGNSTAKQNPKILHQILLHNDFT